MNCRWAIFVSGEGTNLAALLNLRSSNIHLVVSSRAEAPAVDKARSAGIEVLVLPKMIDWVQVLKDLNTRKISHIFLAGFMKVIPSAFLEAWKKPILNLHPSLLPAYPGLKSIERAMADNAALGVTVHKVTSQVDGGEIVVQRQVFPAGETKNKNLDEVKKHMQLAEHEIVKKAFEEASCWT